MSVACGGFLFKERNIPVRFMGAMLMVLGAVVISVKG